jgi:hypothetical protein
MILFGPYIWESMNDDKGDFNARFDIWLRGLLMVLVATLNVAMNELTITFFLRSLNMSLAIFFLLFDYTIAFLLIKNKIVEVKGAFWFTYLSKVKQVDKLKAWAGLDAITRLMIRLAYFTLSLLIYFKVFF